MTPGPWWHDPVLLLVGGAIVGHLLSRLGSGTSERREIALRAMEELHQVGPLTWQAGEAAATRLESHLGFLAAKLSFLKFPWSEAQWYFNSVTALQARMSPAGAEPGTSAIANNVPEGQIDAIRARAITIDRQLMEIATSVGWLRFRARNWRRLRAELRKERKSVTES